MSAHQNPTKAQGARKKEDTEGRQKSGKAMTTTGLAENPGISALSPPSFWPRCKVQPGSWSGVGRRPIREKCVSGERDRDEGKRQQVLTPVQRRQ